MRNIAPRDASELEALEQREWLESLDYVIQQGDRGRVQRLLATLRAPRADGRRRPAVHRQHALRQHHPRRRADAASRAARRSSAASRASSAGTRMAMVVRANKRRRRHRRPHLDLRLGGDALRSRLQPLLPRQGRRRRRRHHLLPGPRLARHLRARVPRRAAVGESSSTNFRRELQPGGGLSSYPHPWLMPDFWEFPTVSMGLGPIMAIYQARFNRYLEDRGLKKPSNAKVWAFLGDGETDEPEALGAITLRGAREARQPDLRHQLQPAAPRRSGARQRPDHPGTRGDLPRRRLERHQGDLGQRVGSAARQGSRRPARQADGRDRRRRSIRSTPSKSGAYIREHFFGADPRLLEMVKHLSDEQLKKLTLGGHDPIKVYNAYKAAVEHKGAADRHPGAHDQGLRPRRSGRRQEHHPPAEEDERRRAAGVPHALRHSDLRRRDRTTRRSTARRTTAPRSSTCASGARRSAASCRRARSASSRSSRRSSELFEEFYKGTEGRKASTTMVFVRMLSKLLRDKEIGKLVVPIVPDEARTFGMEALFRAGRHLLARRPALRAGRHGHAALLQGSEGRPDPRRRASPKPARCRRSSPPAPRTRRTASTRSRSSSTTRCSASSGSAT